MILRRNFLHLVLAAPILKFVGAFRPDPAWTPLPFKCKKYIGKMRITPEAMRMMQSDAEAKRQFRKALQQHLNQIRSETLDFYAAHGDEQGIRAMEELFDR